MRIRSVRELAQGTPYFAVFTATGVCIGRYTERREAEAVVARRPDQRSWRLSFAG